MARACACITTKAMPAGTWTLPPRCATVRTARTSTSAGRAAGSQPPPLIHAARTAAAHWPADTVHVELFASPPPAPPAPEVPAAEAGGDQPFEVVLARSGLTLHVPAGKSILDVILAAGIKAPYVCREGWCGNCETALLGGRADHRDDILEDGQKAAQDTIHVCISRALPGEQLILDR